MSRERYDDAQLSAMRRLQGALEDAVERLGWPHFEGKLAYVKGEIAHELETREREIATMFVPPAVQLANLARWNAGRGWGFAAEEIEALAGQVPPAPAPPPKGRAQLVARTLEIALPDAPDGTPGHLRTFDELWDVVVREQGARPCHLFELAAAFGLRSGAGPSSRPLRTRLALAPGETHRPGLRWRTIDVGHGWPDPDPDCGKLCGLAPRRLPPGEARLHAALLSAAAHFPLWLARMDGKRVPYVWIPGYELEDVPHDLGRLGLARVTHHPRISRSDGRPFLYYGWDHVPFEDHAVPVRLETKTDP
jgi:hypothetical protein